MKKNYKAVILDLDNTLYEYNPNHQKALAEVKSYCEEYLNIDPQQFSRALSLSRRNTHFNLANTASSHNRILYFQHLLESFKLNTISSSLEMYDLYWDTFFKGMVLRNGALEIIKEWNQAGIKICVLTDLTTYLQFRKIQKLALENYIDCIVTSEEVGQEKPHPYAFQTALSKLKCKAEDTIVIGDNWKKDILGALNAGLDAIWFTDSDQEFEEIDNIHVYKTNSFLNIKLIDNE